MVCSFPLFFKEFIFPLFFKEFQPNSNQDQAHPTFPPHLISIDPSTDSYIDALMGRALGRIEDAWGIAIVAVLDPPPNKTKVCQPKERVVQDLQTSSSTIKQDVWNTHQLYGGMQEMTRSARKFECWW